MRKTLLQRTLVAVGLFFLLVSLLFGALRAAKAPPPDYQETESGPQEKGHDH